MGIKGLQSFVVKCHILHDFTLNGSEIVVDGATLIRSLHQGNTLLYGGEYTKFTRQCECFFSNMKSAGIKMSIIFDGSWAEIKYDKIIQKHAKKLNVFANIVRGGAKKSFNLAVFAMECFMGVVSLSTFKDTVEIHTAPQEADPEVARLAEEKGCLALSSDYDLLIYNLTNGFIPMPKLDISTLKRQQVVANHQVQCQRVFARDLAGVLEIDIDSLPTLAALCMHLCTNKCDGIQKTAKQIQNGDCIDKCLQRIPSWKKQNLKRKIEETRRSFQLHAPNKDQPNPGEAATPGMPGERIPERIKRLVESGSMYHGALVVWERREFIPVKQVEDFTKPSSNDISRDIRSFWYGIICAGDRVRPIVTEHSRLPAQTKELNPQSAMCEVELKHEVTSHDGKTIISLCDPDLLKPESRESRRRILMVALEGKEATDNLDNFDEDLQLPLLATRFWFRKVRPVDYIKDTIVSLLSGNVTPDTSTRRTKKIPFQLDVAHAYAQWQSCLVSAHDLNLILGSPLSDLRTDILPNGSDLHRLANAFRNHGQQLPQCDLIMLIESFLSQPP